jgi:NAD(P)-dependent dehydrogenase (short-subunit alcohol dehydrogenase family)
MRFENQVVLVTGASSGIGKASAEQFAAEGAKVGLLGRTEDELQEVGDGIRADGGEALEIIADISDVQAVQQAYETLLGEWGRLDVLFANAGVNGVWAPLDELDPDEWRQTIDINLNGTFYTVKYAVPHLKETQGSVIINASVNGTRMFSNTGATAYASSKAAITAFAKMIALELAPAKVRVNVVCPGMIDTDIEDNTQHQELEGARYPVEYPEGRVPLTHGEPGTSQQVADLVLYLASDEASLITGSEVWIDGAQSLLMG